MAYLSQIKIDNATYDLAAYKLKYAPILNTQAKLNDFIEPYTFKAGYWNDFTPTGLITNGLILSGGWTSTNFGFQIAIDDDPTGGMWLRQKNSSGWYDWKQIPMGDGTGASGTWNININGTSNSAQLLQLHNTITNTSSRSTSVSSWGGSLTDLSYVWGQAFKDTGISSDTGDLVLGLRASQNVPGGTELCMMIDGDYYVMGNKVLHAGNYSSYAATKDHNHDGAYVNVTGDTMTGALNFANGTWNKVGDDCALGDYNQAGVIGIKGLNGATGIYFVPYSGSVAQKISIDGAGTMFISGKTSTDAIQVVQNGVTSHIQSLNASWLHYTTNSPEGHWFNTDVSVQGNIYAGSSYNKLVLTEENYTNYAAKKDHTHSYLPLSGGTLTGGLTIANGADLNLQAPASNTSDSGDLVFKNYSGTEIGRIWLGSNYFQVRFGPSDAAKILLTSGNIGDYAAAKNHTHDDRYLKLTGGTLTGNLTLPSLYSSAVYVSGDWENDFGVFLREGGDASYGAYFKYGVGDTLKIGTVSSGTSYTAISIPRGSNTVSLSGLLNAHGGISLNSSTPQETPSYILGIKAFADGGNIVWQSASSVSVGYANSAGSASSAGNADTVDGHHFHWSGQGGQPTWLWGGNDSTNMYVYNPSNFSVNYANSAGSASNSDTVDGYHATSFGINHNSGDANLNTCTQSGFYRFGGAPTNAFANAAWSQMLVVHGAGDTICQVGMPYNERAIYIRQGNPSDVGGNGSWQGWKRLWGAGDSVTGAVWNDYAECRESDCEEFGYVLMETGDDSLTKTTERLSHFAGISSDTWGFSQGETEKAKTPIAVAGRVLVYTFKDRNEYKPGDCVCAAPGGTVDIMTREEVINWPDRIVGTVSCVPDYDEWGGQDDTFREAVKVNGRIWIKVR